MSGRGGIIPWRLRPSQRQSHTAVLCSQTDHKDEIRKMQEADRAALAMALGMATDWVCRYARELGRNKDDTTPDYSTIAGFAACHGEEQLRRFDELLKDAAVHAPDNRARKPTHYYNLAVMLEQGSPTPPLKE
jgi:hypothetical protein